MLFHRALSSRKYARNRSRTQRLRLEPLEDRQMLSITITDFADDSVASPVTGTLRAAIAAVNDAHSATAT